MNGDDLRKLAAGHEGELGLAVAPSARDLSGPHDGRALPELPAQIADPLEVRGLVARQRERRRDVELHRGGGCIQFLCAEPTARAMRPKEWCARGLFGPDAPSQ